MRCIVSRTSLYGRDYADRWYRELEDIAADQMPRPLPDATLVALEPPDGRGGFLTAPEDLEYAYALEVPDLEALVTLARQCHVIVGTTAPGRLPDGMRFADTGEPVRMFLVVYDAYRE
jgi:hypothetical protein